MILPRGTDDEAKPDGEQTNRHEVAPHSEQELKARLGDTSHRSSQVEVAKGQQRSTDDENEPPQVIGLASQPLGDGLPGGGQRGAYPAYEALL